MHIDALDRHDPFLTRRFWEVGRAADGDGRPWSGYWSWPAARASFTSPEAPKDVVLLGAFEGCVLVGGAMVSLPVHDNRHTAWLEVYVDPQHQRRGTGGALALAAEDLVRRRGRTVVLAEVATPRTGPSSPALHLARSLGYTSEVVDDTKVADLEATARLWPEILAGTEQPAAGYTVRSWWGRCPDELVEGFCRVVETFFSEVPTGELDVEPQRWDERRLRENEDRFEAAGRHMSTTVAIAPHGGIAAMTEVMVDEAAPHRASQGSTLVVPAHRGRRLGLRVKAVNHQRLREAFPGCRLVVTGNADSNHAMNTVNQRLGFRPVERLHEVQHRL